MKDYIIILKKNLMYLYQFQSIKLKMKLEQVNIPLGIKLKRILNKVSQ